MKNIIITFQDEINYGAILQTYALFYQLSKKGETFVLNYKIKNKKNLNIRELIMDNMPRTIIKKIRFKKFLYNYIKLTNKARNKSDVEEICKSINNIVCGSDQIWAFDITKESKDIYLANFNTGKSKVISYAASIGKDKITSVDKEYLQKCLKKFNKISVREKSAHDIISDKFESQVVLDPTLLLDESEWVASLDLKITDNKYILVYMLEHDDKLIETTKEISKIIGIDIICFNNVNRFGNNCHCKPESGPKEFVELFKNASFVVTNSFHGLAFSIVFNKQFVCFMHKRKSTRQENLLNVLNLIDRKYDNTKDIKYYIDNEINYDEVNKLLNTERNKSINFLNDNIEV